MAVGGGSGGHVIPVVAVFKQILEKNPEVELRFWCDKKFAPQAKGIMAGEFGDKVAFSTISSGKFRRYNTMSLMQHLLDPEIVVNNFVDIFRNIAGLGQSFVKLISWRPDVIFCKGGFVCVPAGLAAWVLRIPIVIHDSDAHAGLANRILSRFARGIATGAPLEFYNYPKNISKYVGIPVMQEFREYSAEERAGFKAELGFDSSKKLVVVTGGGLGAERINNAISNEGEKLVDVGIQVMLISGVGQYDSLREKCDKIGPNFVLEKFVSNGMWRVLAAADLVVARAGATSNLELASLAKPTILVPNARLTGGHQLKNAQVYQKSGAVEIVSDDEIVDSPEILSDKIIQVLGDENRLRELSKSFAKFAKPNAAADVADMIFDVTNSQK